MAKKRDLEQINKGFEDTNEDNNKFDFKKELDSIRKLSINKDDSPEVVERKRALQFRKVKEILMQNVSKTNSYSFYKYTKDLIRRYLGNPYNYQNEVREVSRYLYRTSTLYKKIINSYATMPLYRYNVMQKYDLTKEPDYEKYVKEYQRVIQRLHNIDMDKEFQNMMVPLIRDGIYCGYVYDFKNDGLFIYQLDPRYIKISGKNEAGQYIVAMDASYFSVGNNRYFVEPINENDTTGLWDQVFIDGWRLYNEDKMNHRWFILPPEKTITAIANFEDEINFPMPYFTGIFTALIDLMDYQQLEIDKAQLQNYALLVSKIPLIEHSDRVDDFAVSLELVQQMQELIDAAVPELVGTAYSAMELTPIMFKDNSTTNSEDMLSRSINNVFTQAGAEQLIVAGGSSTNALALRYKIRNDESTCFLWVGRLESAFNYYIKRNMSEHISFKFHEETWFNEQDYIQKYKDGATLGTTALDYMTAMGDTPYSAVCKLQMENLMGIKGLMHPLQSSYSTSFTKDGDIDTNTTSRSGGIIDIDNEGGRPIQDEVSEKGEEARNEGRVDGV